MTAPVGDDKIWSWTVRPWRAVIHFWTVPIPAEPLAAFRILLGTVGMVSQLLSLAPYLDRYAGEGGLCPATAMDGWLQTTERFSLVRGPTNIPGLEQLVPASAAQSWARWGEQESAARLFFILSLVALASMTLGLFTRTATIVGWVLIVSLQNRLHWVLNGGDALLRQGLFYLMLAPSGAVWSFDAWRRERRGGRAPGSVNAAPVLIAPWPVRLIQIQLCVIYLFSGLAKMGQDWWSGEAVYWVLNDLELARWSYLTVPVPLILCRLASWGTLLFELGFPLLVIFRSLRPWVLLAGAGFHLGIFLTTEIGWFSQFMLCWYAVFIDWSTAKTR